MKPEMTTNNGKVLNQYGALPFLIAEDGELRVLLVTTRQGRDWIIPKGSPIRKLTPAATAAREAYEEAGLVGAIVGTEPFGSFRHIKRRDRRRPLMCEVVVFLLAVERQVRKWPEKCERKTRWLRPEDAAAMVAAEDLAELLLRAAPPITTF